MRESDLKQRLAAVLAADVAGYARLMSADQRGTVIALDAARSVFRKHTEANQGRVVDAVGDSVLAVFETAMGAVSAALAIQDAFGASGNTASEQGRMRFRIGVHLGDVIEMCDGTVYGDGVNIAARLQALAEPGGVWISDAVHGILNGETAARFADQGEHHVKNVARPLRAFALNAGGVTRKLDAPACDIDLTLPTKPSVAVLPFVNMSGDPAQEYFSDGVTEDIITDLSRFHSLFVTAANSTFTYKNKSVDVRSVARDLGVRYVVEGSIRRADSQVRVTAQLIDALSGTHIWAEKYDRVLEDIFAVQQEVTGGIVATIAPHIDAAERARARHFHSENLSAYDLALQASAEAEEALLKTDFAHGEHALSLARKSLTIDPHNTLALGVIAGCQGRHLIMLMGGSAETLAAWNEGVAAAARLIELEPSNSTGYGWMGMLLALGGRWEAALANARRGHELNSNDLNALSNLSLVELLEGMPEQALMHQQLAMRLSPRDPYNYMRSAIRAAACFLLRDYECGLSHALTSVSEAPCWSIGYVNEAINAVGLGDIALAKSALDAARKLAPAYVDVRLNGQNGYQRPDDRNRVTLAMRIAAGLEEPRAAAGLAPALPAPTSTKMAATDRSIAVMPFMNMSGDKEQEYFADAISDELLNLLAQLPGLRVIARTSSFSFKGKDVDIAEIARKLGVANVLEGSVRKSGDRLRITAQLIRASDSSQLWSQMYDRQLADVFAVQDEIAGAVVEQLKVKLFGGPPKTRATNPQAYGMFLQAREIGRQYSREALSESISAYQRALELDPTYAPAWAGIADIYCIEVNEGLRLAGSGFGLARSAVEKALALDSQYAPAHATLGWILAFHERKWSDATACLEHALSLAPANVDILGVAGEIARRLNRMEIAIAIAQYQTTQDPVNAMAHFNLAAAYRNIGRLDEAIAELRTVLRLRPSYIYARTAIAEVLLWKYEPEAARKEVALEAHEYSRLYGQALVFYATKEEAEAERALGTLISKYSNTGATGIATVYAFRGEADRAFAWLEQAARAGDPWLGAIVYDPLLVSLHVDARWTSFLRAHGMAPEQLAAIKFDVSIPN